MSINKDGLLYVKSTSFTIEPDSCACSYNQLKTIRIEQEGGVVFLNKFEIEDLIKFSRENF